MQSALVIVMPIYLDVHVAVKEVMAVRVCTKDTILDYLDCAGDFQITHNSAGIVTEQVNHAYFSILKSLETGTYERDTVSQPGEPVSPTRPAPLMAGIASGNGLARPPRPSRMAEFCVMAALGAIAKMQLRCGRGQSCMVKAGE